MSKRPAGGGKDAGAGANPSIKLPSAKPLWLHASAEDKYLLLEDPETGDVLMPLIYMKPILEANYSRKLAALKHRQVTVPADSILADKSGLLYWQWAFEAPLPIKALVRRELGDENTPQGHLRLVLVTIVYNALAVREDMHSLPLFRALHHALRRSTYWPLLMPPSDGVVDEVEREAPVPAEGEEAPEPLFAGPATLEACAKKYMFCFRDASQVEQSKKARTTGTPSQMEGVIFLDSTGGGKRRDEAGADSRGDASAGGGSTAEDTTSAGQQAAPAVDFQWGGLDGGGGGMDPPPARGRPGRGLFASLLPPPPGRGGTELGAARGQDAGGSNALLLMQFRQVLQQELLPMQQQLDVLAEEVSTLRRTVLQRLALATATMAAKQGGGAAPPLPPAWPVLPPQKTNELPRQQGPEQDEDRQVTQALATDPEFRQLLQQQLGVTWPAPPRERQAQQAQQRHEGRGQQGAGERGLQQREAQQAQQAQQAQLPRGGGIHLSSSPLASLNYILDQVSMRQGKDSVMPDGAGEAFARHLAPGMTWGPRREAQAGGGGGGGGGAGRAADPSANALAMAADVLLQAAGVGSSGPAKGVGSGAAVNELLLSQAEGTVNWEALLSNLGSSGLDAALQALAQNQPAQRVLAPTATGTVPGRAPPSGGEDGARFHEGGHPSRQPHQPLLPHHNLDDVLMHLSRLKQR